MAFLLAAYDEDEVGGEKRTVLHLDPRLAPYQVAVLPLVEERHPGARWPATSSACSSPICMCDFDVTQSIGKRYRRQDEVGTPFCVTVDFESLEDRAVTVRERDTTEQVRVPIDALADGDPTGASDADASARRRPGRTANSDRSG